LGINIYSTYLKAAEQRRILERKHKMRRMPSIGRLQGESATALALSTELIVR
jgi:hypothetical protein